MGCYFQGSVIIQCLLWYLHRVISVDYTTHTYTEMSVYYIIIHIPTQRCLGLVTTPCITHTHTYTEMSVDYIIIHIPTQRCLGLVTIHHVSHMHIPVC